MKKKKILIHTIALNRTDLLMQMINSIDTKHEYCLYVHVVSEDQEIHDNLAILGMLGTIKEGTAPFKDGNITFNHEGTLEVKWYGYNIGVSHCFNDALALGYVHNDYDMILFVNSDIKFGPGDIDKMVDFAVAKPDKLITICGTHGKHLEKWEGMNLSHGMACAILPKKMFEEVGYFDENIFPAYLEDCDYFTRVWKYRDLGPIKEGYDKISAKDSPLVECVRSGHTHHEGSCVIYSDSRMMERNTKSQSQNYRYYFAKWGQMNDKEKYDWPFDQETDAGHKASLHISALYRHDPYPEYWDRSKEKQKYYATNI